jgi:hypothetical protein
MAAIISEVCIARILKSQKAAIELKEFFVEIQTGIVQGRHHYNDVETLFP